MAYNPHSTTSEDRFPSGIVFFGASSTKPMLDSSSAFIIDENNNSLALADGYYLGSQSYRQLLNLASDGTATFASGVIVQGNLTVNGDVVTVNTEQILVEDNVITLSSGAFEDPSQNAGIEIYRGSGDHDVMRFIWNETSDKWTFTDTSGTYDLVGAYLSQELRYKTLDATYNTFANIPNNALSNSSVTVTAGSGLKDGGLINLGGTGVLNIDLNDLPAGSIANGDSIAFVDANDGNATKKESIADIATLFAGNGLTATNSVINVVGGTGITASANSLDIDATLITSQTAVNDFADCGSNSLFLFFDPDNPSGLKKIDLDQLADALVFNASSDIMSGIYVGDGTNTVLLQDNDFLYFNDSTEIDASLNTTTKTFQFSLNSGSVANSKLENSGVTVTAGTGLAGGGAVALGGSITVDLDIDSQTELSTSPDGTADYILIYDADASSVKKINRSNFVSGLGTMSNFVLEDGDGTEVTITNAKEIKFVEGTGIDINWTDTSNGTDGDPYDLTFNITNVPNSALQNSSITFAGDTGSAGISLGNTINILGGAGISTEYDSGDITVTANVDDSTIELNGDNLQVKDGGITFAKLAGAAVQTSLESFVDDDTSLMTSAAIEDKIESFNYLVSGDLTAGDLIDINSTTINVDLTEAASATIADGDYLIFLDGGATGAESKGTVAGLATLLGGDGLGVSGSTLSVNVDDTTIETNSDTLRVKSSGIDTAQLADGAVTEAKRDRTVVAMTSTATIAATTDIALASNTITLTLPAGVDGKIVRVKNIGTGVVTVSSTDNIDGAGSKILYYQNESMTFVYYGTGSTWYVI